MTLQITKLASELPGEKNYGGVLTLFIIIALFTVVFVISGVLTYKIRMNALRKRSDEKKIADDDDAQENSEEQSDV